jgi:hypothetical protein
VVIIAIIAIKWFLPAATSMFSRVISIRISVIKRPLHLLCDGFPPLLQVELADIFAFALLSADQNAIKMGNFPQFRLHLFSRGEYQLEFWEKLFVISPIFFIVIQKVHGLLYFNAERGQHIFEIVQINQPFVGILYRAIFGLFTDGLVKVKAINVSVGWAKVCFVKPYWEIFVAIDSAAIWLGDTLFIDFLHDGVAIRNGGNENTIDEQVRETGDQSLFEAILCAEHIMEAELGGHDVVERMLDLIVKVSWGEVLGKCVKLVGLAAVPPSFFIALDALLTEVHSHHVLHSG